eukprot:scaffold770_cov255-Pinguiococcus_pyrenoidosus.AAC.15
MLSRAASAFARMRTQARVPRAAFRAGTLRAAQIRDFLCIHLATAERSTASSCASRAVVLPSLCVCVCVCVRERERSAGVRVRGVERLESDVKWPERQFELVSSSRCAARRKGSACDQNMPAKVQTCHRGGEGSGVGRQGRPEPRVPGHPRLAGLGRLARGSPRGRVPGHPRCRAGLVRRQRGNAAALLLHGVRDGVLHASGPEHLRVPLRRLQGGLGEDRFGGEPERHAAPGRDRGREGAH